MCDAGDSGSDGDGPVVNVCVVGTFNGAVAVLADGEGEVCGLFQTCGAVERGSDAYGLGTAVLGKGCLDVVSVLVGIDGERDSRCSVVAGQRDTGAGNGDPSEGGVKGDGLVVLAEGVVGGCEGEGVLNVLVAGGDGEGDVVYGCVVGAFGGTVGVLADYQR